MCDPRQVGEPWKPYESLLPVNAVVCGPNRISARKPLDAADNYGPEQVFVFYRDADVPTAFNQTLQRFEVAGWRVVHQMPALHQARVARGNREVEILVNRNNWGVQGSFNLRDIEPTTP